MARGYVRQSFAFFRRDGRSGRQGEVASIVQCHYPPSPFHRFKDIKRCVVDGDAPPVLDERHAQDVAGKQAANGFVADHRNIPLLMTLRRLQETA